MEFLPKEVLEGLRAAQKRDAAKKARLRVLAGGQIWPVLRRVPGGFALDADEVSHLRGHVDLYDGPKHVATCLIVASEIQGNELICTVKRETPVSDRAALDFAQEGPTLSGYLTKI
ncbi:hypothetical protein BMI91_17600 [Thioclava sediminum]|uniref:Uncharacterized protein n=1 Tax=Thioclava sediminum TaxID=1915319 RepID=A0ABX3MV54_9RHOB|nr:MULTISPECIES: hypothetical protein [Thioclava]OOY09277.1 hypothetical protein BMI89_10080 [Thioclava sp. F36-7]OOY23251.1 hypothetical protein BMI91_17600 [Thioclava sediminum]PFG61740.1 hypothetical protein AXZ77_0289 [Thioclava sp. ES.031]